MTFALFFALLLGPPEAGDLVDIHIFRDEEHQQRIYIVDPEQVRRFKEVPKLE